MNNKNKTKKTFLHYNPQTQQIISTFRANTARKAAEKACSRCPQSDMVNTMYLVEKNNNDQPQYPKIFQGHMVEIPQEDITPFMKQYGIHRKAEVWPIN